jgi:hypothetical protein
MSDSFSKVPAAPAVSHCNGYGSSLKEASERYSRCGGTGLVAVADPGEQLRNGHKPGRLGHAE